MVDVSILEHRIQAPLHAAHAVGLAGPIHTGQSLLVLQRIRVQHLGHHGVVVHAHILAPADDLTDESLGTGQRYPASQVLRLCAPTQFKRVDQPQVDVRRQSGVIDDVLAEFHGIFVRTELHQPMGEKIVGQLPCIALGHRHRKPVGATHVAGEMFIHILDDLQGQRIGLALGHIRQLHTLGQGLSVVLVEIPLAAYRLAAIHQDAGLTAHVAVEVLHAIGAAFHFVQIHRRVDDVQRISEYNNIIWQFLSQFLDVNL